MKFSAKYFFSKCEQIRRKLQICSHVLKKSLKENFISCPTNVAVKGAVMQIEKALINDRLCVSKVS